jgi:hypothetical protein
MGSLRGGPFSLSGRPACVADFTRFLDIVEILVANQQLRKMYRFFKNVC